MAHPAIGTRWAEFLLPATMALPVALVIAVIKPSLSLPLILGTVVLAVAFLSPLTGLYTLVFSMLLGPEFVVGAFGQGTALGRGLTLRFDDLILVLVGLGWIGHMAISEKAGRFVRTSLNRPIIWYTATCVLATMMGVLSGRVSLFGGSFFLLKYYEYFFLYFMAVSIITTREQVRHLVLASLLTCVLVSLYALWQIPAGGRVSAPFEGQEGEPNTLGGYLVFMMAIVAGLLLTPGAVTRKLPLFGLLGLGTLVLQATLSRASFVAAGAVIFAVLEVVRRRSIALLGIFLTALIIFVLLLPNSVKERMLYTFSQPEEAGQVRVGALRLDTSTSDRVRSWETAWTQFRKSPLWGLGITGGPFMDAMYPRVLMETGLLGLTAFLYLLWALFQTGMTAYGSSLDPFARGLALGFLLGLLGLLVHSIGANSFIIVRIMEPFWLYAALVAKGLMLASNNQPPDIKPAGPTVVEGKRNEGPGLSR